MTMISLKANRIFLSPPHMSGNELKFIQDAFESNYIAPLGPQVDAFELEFSKKLGVPYAVAVSSGTAAVHLALKVLGVDQDDYVFCSSLTFAGSANPILYEKAIPVFIDSNEETWNMCPKALERAFGEINKKRKIPKAVIVVNIYGQSADYSKILEICDHYGIPVIEDAAESLGATYKGKQSGNFGKLGTFSFNGNKIVTTSGGGMLVSEDKELINKVRFLTTQARDKAIHYEHSQLGYNYRMSNILAAIGRGQLQVLEERIKTKRKLFKIYHQALSSFEGISFMPEADYGLSTRWLTTLTIDPQKRGVDRTGIIQYLEKENIESRPVWKPMHMQPLYKGCAYFTAKPGISVSDRLFGQGFCLPSGSNISQKDQERVISIILDKLS